MEKIASFRIDHLTLKRGIYVSRKDRFGDTMLTTFDIRMDLFSKGVTDAAASIKAVLASLDAGKVLPTLASAIGNGSLSIAGLDGIAVAPKVSDPLPLHEVLVSEFKHRLELARRPNDAAAFH